MATRYRNPWHKPTDSAYGPEFYETTATLTDYKGYSIFERIAGRVWDVVKDGECQTQMAGPNGARAWIDCVIDNSTTENLARAGFSHRKTSHTINTGEHEVYNKKTGKIIGCMRAHEASEFALSRLAKQINAQSDEVQA
jgi:hypothetical protein